MKWINHTFFSVGASLVVAPQYIPIAIVGGTAPDWLESVLRLMGFPVEHRTVTHYLIEVWLFGTFISLIFWFFSIWGKLFFVFFFCGLLHCLCDATTAMGVPLTHNSSHYSHLWGGRIRTGEPTEYVISIVFFIICIVISSMVYTDLTSLPFFHSWQNDYESGLLDLKEWWDHRFAIF